MAAKVILVFATLLAFSKASPTRRHFAGITEATASDAPPTSGGTEWDDGEDFDMEGDDDWFSKAAVSPSSVPPKARQDVNDYDDDYSRGNVMVEFGEDEDDDEDDDDDHPQDAEEDDGSRNDSEFLFLPPKDSRLMLEDDDDDQSGPIKVRHTGRSNYQPESDDVDNSIESMEDNKDDKDAEEHPYEFTIDQDDDIVSDDDRSDESVETSPRHEDDEDEFVSEGGDDDLFDNPAEESAQVIYGDHVLLY